MVVALSTKKKFLSLLCLISYPVNADNYALCFSEKKAQVIARAFLFYFINTEY